MKKTIAFLLAALLALSLLPTALADAEAELPTDEPTEAVTEEPIPEAEEAPAAETEEETIPNAEEAPAPEEEPEDAPAAEEKPEPPADGAYPEDYDLAAIPELPYNTMVTVTPGESKYSKYRKFTPTTTGTYSIFSDTDYLDVEVYVAEEDGLGTWVASGETGMHHTYYDTRYMPLVAGVTYIIYAWGDDPYTLRIISFADQLNQARQAGAPMLSEAESVHISYDGTEASGIALFTPETSAYYTIRTESGMYKEILGPDEYIDYDYGDSSNETLKAYLIAGETYMLFFSTRNRSAIDFDVTVSSVLPSSYTVGYNEADLQAGPLRYTVIILDDTYMDEEIAEAEREAAMRLCEELAAAGTSYVCIMGMYSESVYGPYPGDYRDEPLFTTDLEVLRNRINVVQGDGISVNIYETLTKARNMLNGAKKTYGDAVETNIVMCCGGKNTAGGNDRRGRYSSVPIRTIEEWAMPKVCNAVYRLARWVGSVHPMYVICLGEQRGSASAWGFWPISDAAEEFYRGYMRDLASDGKYYFAHAEELDDTMGTIAYRITGVERPTLYGDVDGDGSVTRLDAALLLRYLVNMTELGGGAKGRADIDRDGALTPADATAILLYAKE